jgi:hypothetical protein
MVDIVIQWKTLRLDPSSLHTRARGQVFASYARVPAPPTVDRTASIALAASAPRTPPGQRLWVCTVPPALEPYTYSIHIGLQQLSASTELGRYAGEPEDIDIVVIDTYNVPPGQLWDAHQFAIHSGHKDASIKKLAVKAVSMCFLI